MATEVYNPFTGKLDFVGEGSGSGSSSAENSYTHPSTHAATMITEDDDHKFVTADEKTKLAGIESGANNYTLPQASATALGGVKVGSNLSIAEDGTLSARAERFTAVTAIAEYGEYYMHLADIEINGENHTAVAILDIISCNTSPYTRGNYELKKARLVVEIQAPYLGGSNSYNPRAEVVNMYSQGAIGFGSYDFCLVETEKDNVHVKFALLVSVQADERYMYNCSVNNWDNIVWTEQGVGVSSLPERISYDALYYATEQQFVSADEKTKLAGIESGANNYTHPSTHAATMITEDDDHKFVTADEKTKLAGIESGANNYTLPQASATALGGVKVGSNLSIAADGTLSAVIPAGSSSSEGSGASGSSTAKTYFMACNYNQAPPAGGTMPLYRNWSDSAKPTTLIPAQMSMGNQDPFLIPEGTITAVSFKCSACRIGMGTPGIVTEATFDIFKMSEDSRELLQRVYVPVLGDAITEQLQTGNFEGRTELTTPIVINNLEWVGIEFVGQYAQTTVLQQIKNVAVILECEV